MSEPTGSGRFDPDNDPVFVRICTECFTPLDSDGTCPNCTPPPDDP